MSYVQQVLQPGEQVRYQASIHWITYLHGALWLVAAAVFSLFVPTGWRDSYIVVVIRLVLVAGGIYFLARAWFDWWITEIAVTNRRVIYKRGFISRTTAEMHMDKIASVKVDQSILGRIFDYGKVIDRRDRYRAGVARHSRRTDRLAAPVAQQHYRHVTGRLSAPARVRSSV